MLLSQDSAGVFHGSPPEVAHPHLPLYSDCAPSESVNGRVGPPYEVEITSTAGIGRVLMTLETNN